MDITSRALMMGSAATGGSEEYFLLEFYESTRTSSLDGKGAAIDPVSGDIFFMVRNGAASSEIALISIASNAGINYITQYRNNNGFISTRALIAYQGGYVYACDQMNDGVNNVPHWLKFDASTGSLTASRYIGSNTVYPQGFAVDSSGNSYMNGYYSGTGADMFTTSLDSSGNHRWTHRATGPSTDYGFSVATDGSSVYSIGASNSGHSNIYSVIYRLASSNGSSLSNFGQPYWALADASYPGRGLASAVDPYGDLIMLIDRYYSGNQGGAVIKVSASGAIAWGRSIQPASPYNSINFNNSRLCLDQNGNIYIATVGLVNSNEGSYNALLFKFNNSGTLQWQQRIRGDGSIISLETATIQHDGNGTLVIQFSCQNQTHGNQKSAYVLRIPDDGSVTGTYGDFDLLNTSFSFTSGNPSITSDQLTESLTTHSVNTGSFAGGWTSGDIISNLSTTI